MLQRVKIYPEYNSLMFNTPYSKGPVFESRPTNFTAQTLFTFRRLQRQIQVSSSMFSRLREISFAKSTYQLAMLFLVISFDNLKSFIVSAY